MKVVSEAALSGMSDGGDEAQPVFFTFSMEVGTVRMTCTKKKSPEKSLNNTT